MFQIRISAEYLRGSGAGKKLRLEPGKLGPKLEVEPGTVLEGHSPIITYMMAATNTSSQVSRYLFERCCTCEHSAMFKSFKLSPPVHFNIS